MTFVDVPGGPVEVDLVPADGGATCPPLVFLHEGLGSLGMWRDFPAAVRGAVGDPTVLVYSRHGYGRSALATLPRPTSYMHHEADVVLPALLEACGIERPVLIGHSDGASIALLYAGAGRPVAGLVLLAPHVFVEEVGLRAIDAARHAYGTTDLRSRLARHHDDVDVAFRGWNDVWLSPEFRQWNIVDRLSAIDSPVLVVQGTDDPYGTVAQLDAIEARVGGPARRLLLDGVGHTPQVEARQATLDAVTAFICTQM